MPDAIVFSAPSDALASAVLESGPSEEPGFPLVHSMQHVELATLGALALGDELPYGPTYESLLDELTASVADVGDDGPWIFPVPDRMTEALAALTTERETDIATRWAATDELSSFGPEVARDGLALMIDLARTAVGSERHLYLWGSL